MSVPKLCHMLEALIATPSVSSVDSALDLGNHGVTELLAEWAKALGFAVEIQPVPEDPRKSNLIATLGRGEGGLVLAGHTDTVPFDGELWASDPFKLSERDGRFYGLGTSDMKSFLALALEASRGLRAEDMRRPLVILATADEESGMTGAKALLDAGRHYGRHAVIGEPTGMRPVRMHKGMMMEAVRIEGRSGHSSDPSLGVNALEAMTDVLNEIRVWRGELQGRYRDPQFQVPVPTLNLGYLHAGDNPNRICGHAELHIDLRPLPGMGLEALREELSERLHRRLGEGMGRLSIRSLFPGLSAMETPAGAPIVSACEALTGSEAGAVAFGTEGPFFRQLGMDVVIMGPGDIEQAHQPDEYLRLDRIEPTVAHLRALIERFCLRPEETTT